MFVKVLDKYGNPLTSTDRTGKVRRLLKEKKARVVNNNPFTIQLLYDNNLMEDNCMNTYVFSNDLRFPDGLVSKESKRVTLLDDVVVSPDITVYIDVDSVTEKSYPKVKDLQNIDCINVIFFRYDTKSFMDQNIEVKHVHGTAPKIIGLELTPQFKVAPDITLYTDEYPCCGTIGIFGKDHYKSQLLSNIYKQLRLNGKIVEYVAIKNPFYNNSDVKELSVVEMANKLNSLQKEMMERFKLMENEHVNCAQNLAEPLPVKFLIIDELNDYVNSDDYKAVDTIKTCLGSITRLGKAAGIHLILGTAHPKSISVPLMCNITKCAVGPVDETTSTLTDLPRMTIGRENACIKTSRGEVIVFNIFEPSLLKN